MGTGSSKNKNKYDEKQLDIFLNTHMPAFLQSEYCNIGEREWIEPINFWIAFQSYLSANDVNRQLINTTNIEFVKYYFHRLYEKDDIYVTGSCKNNILVGVSIKKWSGTKKTDNRAPFANNIPAYPY